MSAAARLLVALLLRAALALAFAAARAAFGLGLLPLPARVHARRRLLGRGLRRLLLHLRLLHLRRVEWLLLGARRSVDRLRR